MRYYKDANVYTEGLARINRIFDEFENVIVGFSGGKDSTCVFNLTLQVARERNRLPLKVMFVDQEAEWQNTIDYVKEVMYHKDVDPFWIQVPFKITNSTSANSDCLEAWGEGQTWMRDKDPISIKDNVYNTSKNSSHLNEFYMFFPNFFNYHFPNQKSAYLSGVRAEESPTRTMALTQNATYKDITWGRILDKKQQHYTFYPLYDWSYTDIWKTIHDKKYSYCKIYDYMYQYGVPIPKMRVSNLHHETAVSSLFYLQEVEKETYNKLAVRLNGISTANKLGADDYFVRKLPEMFTDWKEYRDFLLEKLLPETSILLFKEKFKAFDTKFAKMKTLEPYYKVCVQSILLNDFGFVKLQNWSKSPEVNAWVKQQKGIFTHHKTNRYS